MAGSTRGLGSNKSPGKTFKNLAARILPEWQVFIRRPNGCTRHFTFTREYQVAGIAAVTAVALWATASSFALTQQPYHLAEKERELEELMAANRAAQHRLASAEKMVGEIAREVDKVHANVVALAESNVSLSKDLKILRQSASVSKTRTGGVPAYEEDGLPGGTESSAVRDQVRRLETALERLRGATSRAVQQTAESADSRISQAQKQLSRLGLDPDRLVKTERRIGGSGGPFIPAPTGSEADTGIGSLMERMAYWTSVKLAMQRLPLAHPIRDPHSFTSGFGSRKDPLNSRTGIHEGIDLAAPIGTPVYATGNAIVTRSGPYGRYGNTIDLDHGNGVTTRYAHLSRTKVKVGQKVTRSTVIGLLGNTGRSTGPHLHYEVRVSEKARNPVTFISVGRDAAKIR